MSGDQGDRELTARYCAEQAAELLRAAGKTAPYPDFPAGAHHPALALVAVADGWRFLATDIATHGALQPPDPEDDE